MALFSFMAIMLSQADNPGDTVSLDIPGLLPLKNHNSINITNVRMSVIILKDEGLV